MTVNKRDILRRKGRKGADAPAASERGVHGEGNYEATRNYYARSRRFVASGRVDEAARDAAPQTPAEAESLEQAEREAKSRARGDDSAATPETGGPRKPSS